MQTSIKQLNNLYRQAKSTFLNADIYFLIINHTPKLTPTQQANLKLINAQIATHFPFLAEIPHNNFHTEPDNIYWKPTTATNILQYWFKQLHL